MWFSRMGLGSDPIPIIIKQIVAIPNATDREHCNSVYAVNVCLPGHQ